jgi:aryl-alcohol dehydrogenase-like predicted oxidoreductase
MPRFTAEHQRTNAAVVDKLQAFARERGLSAGQLALGWTLAKQPGMVTLVGAKTRAHLDDALGALDKPLSAADLEALERIAPAGAISGERYGSEAMRTLDSERSSR